MIVDPAWSESRSTAMHEAGHAVACWLLDTPFQYVTVFANEGSLGHVQPVVPQWFLERDRYDTFTSRQRRWMENHIMISMAGEIAQRAYDDGQTDASRDREAAYDDGCEHDRRAVEDLLSYFEGTRHEELAAYAEWLRQRTITLVGNYRFARTAEAIADELQRSGKVSWRRARRVMADSTGTKMSMVVIDGQTRIIMGQPGEG